MTLASAPLFPSRSDPLRHWARLAPARTALADRGRGDRVGYAELDTAADRWAGVLRRAGLGPGSRVAALAGNRRELIELFFACGRVGAMLIPLNWRLTPAELAPVLAHAAPHWLVGEGRYRAAAEHALAASPPSGGAGPAWIDLDDDAPGLLRRGGDAGPDAAAGPETPALVLYTSGSTGQPKGAVIPHRQLLYNALATTIGWELGPADVAPISTPLFHTGGWNVFATPLWHRGGTVVLFDGFDADAFLEGLADERCTVALTVPTQLLMLTQSRRWGDDLPALRFLISGGAPCPPALADRVRKSGYRFREGYGLTECGPNCFAISDTEAERRPGSVGWPVPFLELRVEAEPGRDAAPEEPGELLLRGPQLFGGYLDDPEGTAGAFAPGGWLRTGDVVRRDADGAVSICGRRKEMYISGGENVFPGEVEMVLAGCPGVAEAVVVARPDQKWGEVGVAFVVSAPDEPVTAAAVLGYARERLAGFKVPRDVVVLDEIPRLGSGKPDRAALVRQASG